MMKLEGVHCTKVSVEFEFDDHSVALGYDVGEISALQDV